MRTTWIEVAVITAIITLVIGVPLFSAWVLWLAWNAVAVPSFSAPRLTYWQIFWATAALWVIGGMFRSSLTMKGDAPR